MTPADWAMLVATILGITSTLLMGLLTDLVKEALRK